MRETLGRRFDVIVVIWALALVIGWSFITLGRDETGQTQWGHTTTHASWVVDSPAPDVAR